MNAAQDARPVLPADVIIVICGHAGERVTRAHGPEASLRLWRSRWVKGGYIARQIDPGQLSQVWQPEGVMMLWDDALEALVDLDYSYIAARSLLTSAREA